MQRIFVIGALMVIAASARAHHSFAAEFLAEEIDTIEGVVTEVWFRNPHARYYVAVTLDDGSSEEWDVRTTSPTILVRRGWNEDSIKAGDKVKITGHLGKDGRKLMQVITIEMEDGRLYEQRY